jgi:hypothetical protein
MPTPEEAKQQAHDLLATALGLDAFQRIAVADLMNDLEGFTWPPAPDSLHEKKLMELGSIITGHRGSL